MGSGKFVGSREFGVNVVFIAVRGFVSVVGAMAVVLFVAVVVFMGVGEFGHMWRLPFTTAKQALKQALWWPKLTLCL